MNCKSGPPGLPDLLPAGLLLAVECMWESQTAETFEDTQDLEGLPRRILPVWCRPMRQSSLMGRTDFQASRDTAVQGAGKLALKKETHRNLEPEWA